jgi:hypothetical protein
MEIQYASCRSDQIDRCCDYGRPLIEVLTLPVVVIATACVSDSFQYLAFAVDL